MTDKVVDASAVVALLFNELTRDVVVERLRGATLHAPGLIGFEVANACLKKMRATPGERQALIEAYALFDRHRSGNDRPCCGHRLGGDDQAVAV